MLYAAFLAVSLVSDATITLDSKCISAPALMTEITRQTGQRFLVEDEARMDFLAVHLDHVPVRTAMDKIAEAQSGEWSDFEGGHRLRRSPKILQAEADARRAKTIQSINKAFAAYRQRLASHSDFTVDEAEELAKKYRDGKKVGMNGDWYNRLSKIAGDLPCGRAAQKILMSFPAETLADIPVRHRVVFSTHPTAMQNQLPGDVTDAIKDLVSEQAIWHDAYSKFVPRANNEWWFGFESTHEAFSNVGVAVVAFSRWDENQAVNAELILADSKGKILSQTNLSPGSPWDAYAPAADPVKYVAPKPEPKIPLSPIAVAAAKVLGYMNGKAVEFSQQPSDLQTTLLRPDLYNPASLFMGESLVKTAIARKENLVAVLDDGAIADFAQMVGKDGFNPAQIQNDDPNSPMEQFEKVSYHQADGWLIERPKRWDVYAESQCNTVALATLIAKIRKEGRANLDDLADYAAEAPRFDKDQMATDYLRAIFVRGESLLNENDYDLLRFYGSLSPEQRKEPRLPFAAFNPAQIKMIFDLVFGMYSRLSVSYTNEESSMLFAASDDGEPQMFFGTLKQEPTYCLPNGITPDGYLTLTPSTNDVLSAHMQFGEWDQGYQTQDIQSLAWQIYQAQHGSGGWQVLGLRPVNRRQLTFTFQLAPNVSQSMMLSETKSLSDEVSDLSKLPEAMRKELTEKLAEIDKMNQNGQVNFNEPGINTGNGAP